MAPRPLLALPAALIAALIIGAPRAEAATTLGSPDTMAPPEAFACAEDCPPSGVVGFRQLALRGADVEAPEDGVLVEASAFAKRLSGSEPARVAVLRPGDDGNGVDVVASAPLPVTSPAGAFEQVENLRLPVQRGDSVGILFRTGEVDLGVRMRRKPDGAVQSFTTPCGPCSMDGGTGRELLLDAIIEPDVDADGLGDETQDPDGGGLGLNWVDDWFEDFEEGDELDADVASQRSRPSVSMRLRRSTSSGAGAAAGRSCCCGCRGRAGWVRRSRCRRTSAPVPAPSSRCTPGR